MFLVKDSNRNSEPAPLEKYNWLVHFYHVTEQTHQLKELIKKEMADSCGQNEYSFYKRGIILREEGKLSESLESFQICHKLNPDNEENIKQIGKCL